MVLILINFAIRGTPVGTTIYPDCCIFALVRAAERPRIPAGLALARHSLGCMKRILLAGAAVLVLTAVQPTLAADAPVAYKAAPPAVALYNWTGAYVGGHLGYGRATAGITDIDCYCIAAPPFDFPGFQFKFGYDGWIGGAQLGYNLQAGSLVYGVELDFSYSGMRTSFPSPIFLGSGETYSSEIKWFGTGRARLGYAFDRVLPYVTGGFAFADIENRYNESPIFSASSVASGIKWGWTVGGGVELAIDPAWTIRGEYLYVQLQTVTASNFPAAVCGAGCRFDWDNHFHIGRVALNRRF